VLILECSDVDIKCSALDTATFQAEVSHMQSRVDAADEYLKSLISEALSKFNKGEWLGAVRSRST
jgi:hypothetical protein